MTRLFTIAFAAFAAILASGAEIKITASSGANAAAAFDGDRFGTNAVWRGDAGEKSWSWQIDFGEARKVGAILQVCGDHDFVFEHAPRNYKWLGTIDGENWKSLDGCAVTNEQRLFRVIRLARQEMLRGLRVEISEAESEFPALREIEFASDTKANFNFPDWIVVVNATHDPKLPGEGKEFIPLARKAEGQFVPAQQVWLDRFNPEFLSVEPRPVCAFVSGSFKDWCEVRREDFRGMSEVLKDARLPMWASCGGAQALAIIAETGVDQEWDCPHCRDPKNPKSPIYGHIGHIDMKKCGDYSGCIFERGPHVVDVVKKDRVFAGLGGEFQVMESHCGQIEYMPKGWEWLIGPGPGTRTKHQAFRWIDAPIYAAQFHIEMSGTPETSEQIMKNFLGIARDWRTSHLPQ